MKRMQVVYRLQRTICHGQGRSGKESKLLSAVAAQQLRAVIRQGHPWVHYRPGGKYCPSGLNTRLDILLSYVCGVFGLGVGLAGGSHPSKQTVEHVRSVLNDDLVESFEKYGHLVSDEDRWSYEDLFQQGPDQPPREEY